ncbi:hypothetical protein RSSM_04458 [Rhodopirellula sallentina SM41]|uniref:Uncharacterized protein n=1 Tax=Rhodopirellula sallentina SM41 TaxID=1263870 RepID=M5UDL4_9BACT|nr:hypothetical protein RSSM_04458 [Rhodopirellula sallentina SM41]
MHSPSQFPSFRQFLSLYQSAGFDGTSTPHVSFRSRALFLALQSRWLSITTLFQGECSGLL